MKERRCEWRCEGIDGTGERRGGSTVLAVEGDVVGGDGMMRCPSSGDAIS